MVCSDIVLQQGKGIGVCFESNNRTQPAELGEIGRVSPDKGARVNRRGICARLDSLPDSLQHIQLVECPAPKHVSENMIILSHRPEHYGLPFVLKPYFGGEIPEALFPVSVAQELHSCRSLSIMSEKTCHLFAQEPLSAVRAVAQKPEIAKRNTKHHRYTQHKEK